MLMRFHLKSERKNRRGKRPGRLLPWTEPLEVRVVPATINVTSTAPIRNYSTAVTISGLTNPNNVTIFDAIDAANNTPGADTIVLQANAHYTLTRVFTYDDNSDTFNLGLPFITSPMTIQGNGATLERSTAAGTPNFRFMLIRNEASDVTVDGVTFTNARTGATFVDGRGSAISGFGDNPGSLNVTVTNCTMFGNRSTGNDGGAVIYTQNANLTVDHCVIRDNVSTGVNTPDKTATARGAGIFAREGNVRISNTTFTGNSATEGAALELVDNTKLLHPGIYNFTTVATNCVFANNRSVGSLVVDGATTTDIASGGAIDSLGMELTLVNSAIYGNSAAYQAGAIRMGGAPLTVIDSTISGNVAADRGGAIEVTEFFGHGSLRLVNSTVSGNSLTGGQSYGAGIVGGDLTIINSTVANNFATASDSIGGGIVAAALYFFSTSFTDANLSIDNSIVARNQSATGPDLYLGPPGASATATLRSSLIGDAAGTALVEAPVGSPDGLGNLIGGPTHGAIDPLLGPLANNGGPTQTLAISTNSPAYNAGSNALVPAGVVNDQRGPGFSRTGAGRVDMGAFELQTLATGITAVSGAATYGGTATLVATLKQGSSPLANQTIIFSVGGVSVGSATTNSSGTATLAGVSLGGRNAGTHTSIVGAAFDGAGLYTPSSGSGNLVIAQAAQTISWSNPATIAYGTPLGAAQLNAVVSGVPGGTAPGALTYTPNAGTVLDVGNGQSLRVDAAGTINYLPATRTVFINVVRADPTITWATPAPITYGAPLGATQLNATASVPGTFNYAPAAGTVLNAGAGLPLSLTFIPSDTLRYNSASATRFIDVAKATPTLTVTGATATYDALPHSASFVINGVNGDDLTSLVSLTYADGAGMTTNNAPINAGTHGVTATFAGNGNYLPVTVATETVSIAKAAPTIAWSNPASIIYGTPLGAAQLNAVVSGVPGGTAPGASSYTPGAGTVLDAGDGQPLRVDVAESSNYLAASRTVSINILAASTQLNLLTAPNPSVAGQYVTLTATVSTFAVGAGVPTGTVTFSDATTGQTLGSAALAGGVATIDASFTALGAHQLMATYAPTPNFATTAPAAATQTVQRVAFLPGPQAGEWVLYVGGTNGDDDIDIHVKNPKSGPDTAMVHIHTKGVPGEYNTGWISAPSGAIVRVVAYGLDGDDKISVDDQKPGVSSFLFGGAGNDKLDSGRGPSVLVGGDGDDELKGDEGASLLIGGRGSDKLKAGKGMAVLIGGTTDFDVPTPAGLLELDQALAAWSSGGVSAASAFLNSSTVHDDNCEDELSGGDGLDWFLANVTRDSLKKKKSNDVVTDVTTW